LPLVTRTGIGGLLYRQDAEPGNVLSGDIWCDTNSNLTYRRNDTNDGWNIIGSNPDVTATEYGYLDGVTSPIQTQFGTKADLASPVLTGSVTLPEVVAGVGAGKMKLLGIGSITGADDNEVKITGLSYEFADYSQFMAILETERDAGTGDMHLQLNSDATANYHGIETQFDATPAYVAETSQTSFKISTEPYGNNTGEQSRSCIWFYLPNDVIPFSENDIVMFAKSHRQGANTTSDYIGLNGSIANSLSAIRFFINTGASKMKIGTKLYLYGLRK